MARRRQQVARRRVAARGARRVRRRGARARSRPSPRKPTPSSPASPGRCSTRGPPRWSRTRATSRSSSCATASSAPRSRAVAVGHARPAGRPPPLHRPRRAAALAATPRTCPGRFPFTAGVFPFKREDEDPARMFAGEGDAFRTNRAVPPARRGPARDPPLDRVRLGHPLRLRPRRAPRHLRQGRQLGRVDRDARRHEGALRRLRPVRPDHVGVDDDQRARADDPRDVPQHRDRPAHRRVRRRARPRARRRRGGRDPRVGARQRARHGAGRHPEGGPGPEHLHLLHRVLARDDGRHPGVVRRAAGAQLLLGVDLRLPHRRGRREPDLPARVHPRQRASPTSRRTSRGA